MYKGVLGFSRGSRGFKGVPGRFQGHFRGSYKHFRASQGTPKSTKSIWRFQECFRAFQEAPGDGVS